MGAALAAIALAGCSESGAGPTQSSVPCSSCDLHLYVSNQSFDDPTADLLVSVDGVALFDGEAKVEGQHNWMLREADLAPGTHRVDALERETGARGTTSFTLAAGEERWVVVDYWNPLDSGSGRSGSGPGFTFHVSEEPVAFA